MQPHPYADLFPMMDKKALQELVASIRDDGLQQPIVTYEGKILDGRNRSLACSNAQVKKVYVKYTGDDPLGFVMRANLTRRHLTTSQRAMVAAKMANLQQGQKSDTAKAVTQEAAAAILNISPDSIQRAKKVIASGDEEVIEAVRSGDMSVGGAQAQLYPTRKPSRKFEASFEASTDLITSLDQIHWAQEQLASIEDDWRG